jgi:tellurite resistance protein TerA
MIFYNCLKSLQGEVNLSLSDGNGEFTVDLERLPPIIDKLVFTANVDGQGVMSGSIRLRQCSGELRLPLYGVDFAMEKAFMVLEVYRKDGWRAAFPAAGFNGGLPALLRHFGGEEMASEQVNAGHRPLGHRPDWAG